MFSRLRPPNSWLNQSQWGRIYIHHLPSSMKQNLYTACGRLYVPVWGWGDSPLSGWGLSCSLNCWGKPLPLLSVLASHLISSCYYQNLFCFKLYSFLQLFNKICLAQYVHWLADQLHADAMQQLEVAILRTPVANCIEVLAPGLSSSCDELVKRVLPAPPLITSVKAFTDTPSALPPVVVPIIGVTDAELQEVPGTSKGSIAKKRWITPTPVEPPTSTAPSTPKPSSDPISYSVVHVPEMTIPDEWYPEQINLPNASKEYQCQGCRYSHSNLDTILTHVRKEHLNITIGCPTCGKPY